MWFLPKSQIVYINTIYLKTYNLREKSDPDSVKQKAPCSVYINPKLGVCLH